ncbi:MAG: hypothetical protein ABIZ91_10110 [Gemmatimonadaceae bacterium]
MRAALTLMELLVCLTLLGAAMTVAVPAIGAARDRAAVRGATGALVSALAEARHLATRWNRRTAVRIDTLGAHIAIHAGGDTVSRVPLALLFGVRLAATRDSLAFYSTGLGVGAANARFIVARGVAAETVTISRAGRVRR